MDKKIGLAFMLFGALFPAAHLYGHLVGKETVSEMFSFVGIALVILGALMFPNSHCDTALGKLAEVGQKFLPWKRGGDNPPAP